MFFKYLLVCFPYGQPTVTDKITAFPTELDILQHIHRSDQSIDVNPSVEDIRSVTVANLLRCSLAHMDHNGILHYHDISNGIHLPTRLQALETMGRGDVSEYGSHVCDNSMLQCSNRLGYSCDCAEGDMESSEPG